MKKKASVLPLVLIMISVLLFLGATVSVGILNTAKYNRKYMEVVNLELTAKSSLNIGVDNLLKKIKSNNNTLPNDYIITSEELESFIPKDEVVRQVKIEKKENKYIVTAIAEFNGVSKSQVKEISIKINESTNPPKPVLPDIKRFINVCNNANISNTSIGIIQNLAYGNNFTYQNNNAGIMPLNDKDLMNIIIEINTSEVAKDKEIFLNMEKTKVTSNDITVNNDTILYESLNGNNLRINMQDSKVMFDGNSTGQNTTTIGTLTNSLIVINGNFEVNNILEINNMINSSIIIVGDLKIQNDLKMNQCKDSKIIVLGNLELNNRGNVILETTLLAVGGELRSQNGFNISSDNGVVFIGKDIELPNGINGTVEKSFIMVGNNLNIQNSNGDINFIGDDYITGNVTIIEAINTYIILK